jgi:hypothetical protein
VLQVLPQELLPQKRVCADYHPVRMYRICPLNPSPHSPNPYVMTALCDSVQSTEPFVSQRGCHLTPLFLSYSSPFL